MNPEFTRFLHSLINTILGVKDSGLKKDLLPLLKVSNDIIEAGKTNEKINQKLTSEFSCQPIVKEVFSEFPSSSKIIGGRINWFRKGWTFNKMIDFIAHLNLKIRRKDQELQPKTTNHSPQQKVFSLIEKAVDEILQEQRLELRLIELRLNINIKIN